MTRDGRERAARETMTVREYFNPPTLFKPDVYSQAVKVGNMVFVAGQCATASDRSVVGIGDPHAQARQCYQNLRAALEAAGATMRDVVKVITYSTHDEYRKVLIDLRREFFEPPYPASTGVVVTSLARPEFLFEIKAIAILEGQGSSSGALVRAPCRQPLPTPG